jgi:hypothetical protein
MAWNGDATTQVTDPINKSTTDNALICLNIKTTGNLSALNLDNITVSLVGSTQSSDVDNLKVFYTGSSSTFNNSTQYGSTQSSPGNSSSYTISGTATLGTGNNYFWISCDVPSGATINDVIDAEVTAYTVSGTGYTPGTTSPSGNRKIDYCVPVYTGGCDNGYLAISNVQLDACTNGINNYSGWSCSAAVSDYTSLPAPSLEQGFKQQLGCYTNLLPRPCFCLDRF